MDKKQEIKILQSLKGDTYFADFFGSHDIDQMCENIKNDFGLEYCCQFYQKASIFEKQVEEEKRKVVEVKETFVRGLIEDFEGDIPMPIYKRLIDSVGVLFIINHKRDKGYPLNDCEIDWLVLTANDKNCK